MSLFQCDNCGCLENTACSSGTHISWSLHDHPDCEIAQNDRDMEVAESYKEALGLKPTDHLGEYCSACSPVWYTDGGAYGLGPIPKEKIGKGGFRDCGMWHGEFERTFFPLGAMNTDADGNLAHGSREVTRDRRNSPSIDQYVLGTGEDFDWKKANEEWEGGVHPAILATEKDNKNKRNKAKRQRKR